MTNRVATDLSSVYKPITPFITSGLEACINFSSGIDLETSHKSAIFHRAVVNCCRKEENEVSGLYHFLLDRSSTSQYVQFIQRAYTVYGTLKRGGANIFQIQLRWDSKWRLKSLNRLIYTPASSFSRLIFTIKNPSAPIEHLLNTSASQVCNEYLLFASFQTSVPCGCQNQ